jgi:hypothetical protein
VRLSDGRTDVDAVLRHPRHEGAQKSLPELIGQLRACRTPADGYEFQEALFAELLEVEKARNALSRAAKRMKAGKPPQPGAPEPQSGLDPGQPETWQLEHDVCERIARQFRCVGDALAWRVFGFQRKYVIALSQNAPPGVMAGKEGLAAERDRVRQAWEDGRFALLHDLTNCLRIGDVTVFGKDGSHEIIEVKSDAERRSPAQRRRIRAAEDALQGAGPLPGNDRRAHLYDLDVPFRTHLDLLRYGLQRAAGEGIFTARLPGARMLVAADIYGCSAQGWTDDEYQHRLDRQLPAARRRAGLGRDRTWNMTATSLDSVARDPLRVPFAAYPLHPVTCARLIGDLAFFAVETNGPALEQCLAAAGIDADWVLPPDAGPLAAAEVVMEMVTRTSSPGPGNTRMELSRTLQMRRSELDRYLIELLDHETWVKGVGYLLADADAPGRPWPHFRGEDQEWV